MSHSSCVPFLRLLQGMSPDNHKPRTHARTHARTQVEQTHTLTLSLSLALCPSHSLSLSLSLSLTSSTQRRCPPKGKTPAPTARCFVHSLTVAHSLSRTLCHSLRISLAHAPARLQSECASTAKGGTQKLQIPIGSQSAVGFSRLHTESQATKQRASEDRKKKREVREYSTGKQARPGACARKEWSSWPQLGSCLYSGSEVGFKFPYSLELSPTRCLTLGQRGP